MAKADQQVARTPTPEQQLLESCGGDINVAVASAWKTLDKPTRDMYEQQSRRLKAAAKADLDANVSSLPLLPEPGAAVKGEAAAEGQEHSVALGGAAQLPAGAGTLQREGEGEPQPDGEPQQGAAQAAEGDADAAAARIPAPSGAADAQIPAPPEAANLQSPAPLDAARADAHEGRGVVSTAWAGEEPEAGDAQQPLVLQLPQ